VGVVLLDKAGKPVRDLNLSEVQLKDNGRLQQIRSFEPAKFGVDLSSAGSTQRLPPGYHSNRETYQSTASAVFLLMDSLNTPFEDQTYAIRAAQHVGAMKTKLLPIQGAFLLDRFGSLQAIPTEEGIGSLTDQGVEPSSAARDRTPRGSLQHLDNPSASGQRTGSFKLTPEEQRIRFLTTLGAFRGIAQSLGGLPGRKTVVWLSSGLSLKPLLEDNMPFWRNTMDQLNASDIAIYGVDTMGLRLLSGFSASNRCSKQSNSRSSDPAAAACGDFDILRLMAEETGGRVYANSNDLESALTAARLDAESAYELTFIPDRIDERPKKHRLQVNIARPHSNVRYRLAYWSMPASRGFASAKSQIVDDVLASPMEATAFSIAATINRESKGNGEFNILVLVEPRKLS